uniref:hypothetical protein n=1 Tax=Roseburia sp. TaxID=2049040 RepID=UPI003FEFA473
MHEKLVIVPKQRTTGKKILIMVWFALACICILMSTFVTPLIFSVPAILFGVIWYFQAFQSDIEWEYTYFDGDLHMARIKAKRKRKRMAEISMEDVLMIAPKGDRGVYKYENDKNVPCKNLTSGNADAKVYELIAKSENNITRYEFEPDEEMLDAIMVKYPRLVVK